MVSASLTLVFGEKDHGEWFHDDEPDMLGYCPLFATGCQVCTVGLWIGKVKVELHRAVVMLSLVATK